MATASSFLHQAVSFEKLGIDRVSSRVLIVGLGKTGYSVATFLQRQGVPFFVADDRKAPPYLMPLSNTLPEVPVFLGPFRESVFQSATHLVVSPGLPIDIPEIVSASRQGIPILGDLDLFACAASAPIVGITGSNGKSTVTTLTGQMAHLDGKRVQVGGNLGTPMLDLLDEKTELYVLELSSFQLERSSYLESTVATVLNVTPDHLDRHPDLIAYAEIKRRVLKGANVRVLNKDDPLVARMEDGAFPSVWFSLEEECDYTVVQYGGEEWLTCRGQPFITTSEVRLAGRHNVANVLASLALGETVGISPTAMRSAIRTFAGLEHRMQWVGEHNGVGYINDSKATNVGACIAALKGLDKKVVLLAGGDGKGADFRVLRPVVAEKVRAVVVMGRDAFLLEEALSDLVTTVHADSLSTAVHQARMLAHPGDIVLLAPACSSLDQYKNYQERGQQFTQCVRGLL